MKTYLYSFLALLVLSAAIATDAETQEKIADGAKSAEEAANAEPVAVHELPHRSRYQRVLREYLGSLTVEDFTVPNGEIVMDEEYLSNSDNLFRVFFLMRDPYGRGTSGMFDLAPEAFTLKGIESAEGVRLRARADFFPAGLLWWAEWDYPGNPFYQSSGVLNRALAFSIVDMLMLEYAHRQSFPQAVAVQRSDFLGGSLAWIAMTYAATKDSLPEEIRIAYEEGMERFVDRLIEWGPRGVLGNIDCIGLVGMAYIANSVDNPKLAAKAKQYAKMIVDKVVTPAGYVTDGGITDLSYNGLALYHVAWAARISGWNFLDEATRRMLRFKALFTFPDPDGRRWSPSHFTFRTSAGPANDQWAFVHREYALALGWPDLAGYLLFDGQRAAPLPDTEKDMLNVIQVVFAQINQEIEKQRATPKEASLWGEEHFDVRRNWAVSFYKDGEYQMMREWAAQRPALTRLPVQNEENYLENLDDKIAIARFPTYAAMAYVGHIGVWDENLVGFGGGTLSAFWTPETGSAILSRRRGYQHPNKDRLDEWRIWPTNAISGLTKKGKMFTSALVLRPEATVTQSDGELLSTAVGQIGEGLSAADGALGQPIDYRRTFQFLPKGVTVTNEVSGGGLSEVESLYEMIPVFIGDARFQPDVTVEILFVVGGTPQVASIEPVEGVEAILIKRFAGEVRIELDRPRTAMLSPEVWEDTYQSNVKERNVMVDITPTAEDLAQGSSGFKYEVFAASPIP